MRLSHRTWSILWLLLLAAAALLLYGSGLHGKYFSDDFTYYYDPIPSDPFHFFYNQNPGTLFYRPLQTTFVLLVQRLWGMQTFPIHLVTLLCHLVFAWLIALSVVRLGYSRLQGMIGSIFFLVAQVSTYVVLSNDTLSQVGGALFGCLAPWLLYFPGRAAGSSAAPAGSSPPLHYYLLALLCFAISLGLKETSTGYLALVAVALLIVNLERAGRRQALIRTALQLLPFVLLVIVYMMVRSQFVPTGPQFGDSRYDLKFGLNIPINIVLFIVASLTAHSSVTSYVAMQQRDPVMIAVIALPILLFAGLILAGLWRLRHDRTITILLLFYFLGFFPAILFNRVSEHYTYNALPFHAALAGIAIGELYRRATASRQRILLATAGCLLLLIHVVAIQSKSAEIVGNGERAAAILEQLRPIVETAPPNGTVVLVNPPDLTIEYSIYRMNGFKVLEAGFPGTQTFLGRPDLTMYILSYADIPAGTTGLDTALFVTLANGKVVPLLDSFSTIMRMPR